MLLYKKIFSVTALICVVGAMLAATKNEGAVAAAYGAGFVGVVMAGMSEPGDRMWEVGLTVALLAINSFLAGDMLGPLSELAPHLARASNGMLLAWAAAYGIADGIYLTNPAAGPAAGMAHRIADGVALAAKTIATLLSLGGVAAFAVAIMS